jgi:hypothetical protein
MRERAGRQRAAIARARGPLPEDRVRARNDRADRDLPRRNSSSREDHRPAAMKERPPMMTAYLISLALFGLIAIAIWESFS